MACKGRRHAGSTPATSTIFGPVRAQQKRGRGSIEPSAIWCRRGIVPRSALGTPYPRHRPPVLPPSAKAWPGQTRPGCRFRPDPLAIPADGRSRLPECEHQRGDAVPLEAIVRGAGAQQGEVTEGAPGGERPFTAAKGRGQAVARCTLRWRRTRERNVVGHTFAGRGSTGGRAKRTQVAGFALTPWQSTHAFRCA